ncbi:MAG: adenine-specific methyltransferase EcoRI family protein [Mycoplasmoidaceae bacterium]
MVITNPPFSLFREYIAQLIKYKKKFLIIGNMNAITYKEIFPLFKENRIWLGFSNVGNFFKVPKTYKVNLSANAKLDDDGNQLLFMKESVWFTNLKHNKINKKIYLHETYKGNENKYPKYINYDAINVDRVDDIPKDYYDVIGVPISFLMKHNSDQFKILYLGVVGSCDFKNNYKCEIYKDGKATSKFTKNCKGNLYYKWNDEMDKKKIPKYRNVENGDFYIAPYMRILIKRI